LIHLQRYKSVGDEMVLEVLRDGRVTNFVVELDERPNSGINWYKNYKVFRWLCNLTIDNIIWKWVYLDQNLIS